MGVLARNFARPSGLVGDLVGRAMARGNGGFNKAVVRELADRVPDARRVAELGCGPGVGLASLLRSFPGAAVTGLDLSPRMVAQSSRRNRAGVNSGRLRIEVGGVDELRGRYDLVVAVHVLYFLPDPIAVLGRVRAALAPDGLVALGYRCRDEMPKMAQRTFPEEGHRLYEDESDVQEVLVSAGFRDVETRIVGSSRPVLGRLSTGRA